MTLSSASWSRSPERKTRAKRALASILTDRTPFETADAVDVAFDVCEALASLHANGIVHGDLGPHCIRLAWPRQPGQHDIEIFALATSEESATISVRRDGASVMDRGAFVAPEQRRVGGAVDARADIWAIGALLRWMLAGAERPRTLTKVVDACLATDPALRPSSIDVVAEKIASFAASPPDCFERLAERRRRTDDALRALARREARDSRLALDRLEQLALERERDLAGGGGANRVTAGGEQLAMDRLVSTVAAQTGSAPPDVAAPPELVLADESDVEIDDDDRDGDLADFDAALLDSSEVLEAPGEDGAAVRHDLDLDFDDDAETVAREDHAPDAWRNAPTLPAPPVTPAHASAPVHARPPAHAFAPAHASAPAHAGTPIERRSTITPLRATLDPIRPRRWPLAIAAGLAIVVCSATFAFLVSSGEPTSPQAANAGAVTTLTTLTTAATVGPRAPSAKQPTPARPLAPTATTAPTAQAASPAPTTPARTPGAAAAITPASLPDARDGAQPLAARRAAPSMPPGAAPVMTATLDSLPDAPRR